MDGGALRSGREGGVEKLVMRGTRAAKMEGRGRPGFGATGCERAQRTDATEKVKRFGRVLYTHNNLLLTP